MKTQVIKTTANLEIEVEIKKIEAENALDIVINAMDSKKGGVFSSGFDFPGRHSRWDIAFSDPALEFRAKAKEFSFNALNKQGEALLDVVEDILNGHDHIERLSKNELSLSGTLLPPPKHFPEEKRSRQASVFSILRSVTNAFKTDSENKDFASLGLYGAFGYDLVNQFEDLNLKLDRDPSQADCHLFLPLELLVIDRKLETSVSYNYSIKTPKGHTKDFTAGGKTFSCPKGSGEDKIETDHKPGEFAKKVEKVIEGTKKGDYFEVVLSQNFSSRFDIAPSLLFKELTKVNPSPYMFFLNFGEEQLVGASPEIYVRVTGDRYETCPIAGTVRRGETAIEDANKVRELLFSEKEESELTMCTDVDRNDMARVCEPGSVKIIGRRQLEFYSHLIHTVDHLEGKLSQGFDSLDAFQTHMWACTVTGAPKPAALQTIEDLENSPRGWYSGAVGFLSFNGDINTGITLRFAHLKNGRASTRAGATLLYGSDAKMEEQETRTKSAAFFSALERIKSSARGEVAEKSEDLDIIEKIKGKKRKILFIDCRDSFVHNLASYMRQLGGEVVTLRAGFPVEMVDEINPDLVLFSPGPGSPEEFGIPALVGHFAEKKTPLFGVCLGHQGIGQHFGAELAQLPVPFHGKPSQVSHNSNSLLADISSPFTAGRYHSLYLKEESMPECLEITASTEYIHSDGTKENIPMAIRHKELPIASVQFHPESLMTLNGNVGHLILKNAIEVLTQ